MKLFKGFLSHFQLDEKIYVIVSVLNNFSVGHSMSCGSISGNIPTSTSPILMKFYQLLQIFFKLGSVKFQLEIMIGWSTFIANIR